MNEQEEFSLEKSQEQAKILKDIQFNLLILDVDYLEKALKQLRNELSFRNSAMVLNPSPMTAIEQGKLEEAKLNQLEFILKAAKNTKVVQEKSMELLAAKQNAQQIGKMFGL